EDEHGLARDLVGRSRREADPQVRVPLSGPGFPAWPHPHPLRNRAFDDGDERAVCECVAARGGRNAVPPRIGRRPARGEIRREVPRLSASRGDVEGPMSLNAQLPTPNSQTEATKDTKRSKATKKR